MSRIIKVMILAGGTGGHVFPALAVAQELMARKCEIQWIGTSKGIEARIVPENKIVLNFLEITGVRGKGLSALLLAPFKIIVAIHQAKTILKRFGPDVVLGMGGYVSGPSGIAAWLLRIPLIVHEQNARPGTTNSWLAKIATRVLAAFPDVLENATCIGNPIRKTIIDTPPPSERFAERRGPLRVLVLGGSLGAKAINELVPKAFLELSNEFAIEVKHQTGAAHFEQTKAIYDTFDLKADVQPFIEDMAQVLCWADLVVCRSGALTVSELAAVGVASILVPFPFAIDDHQTANALWLVQQHAAIMQNQNTLTVQSIKNMIVEFIQNPDKAVDMAKAARAVAMPTATAVCADICLELANA